MKKGKMLWVVGAILITLLIFTLSAALAGQPQIVMKLGGTTPPSMTHPEYASLVKFRDVVKQETNDRLRVDIYPSLQLGTLKEPTEAAGGGHRYDHNLVKATRHQGLCGATTAYHNEIYINSYVTNSIGVLTTNKGGPVDVAHNRIYGVCNHPIAFAVFGAYGQGAKLHHNYAEVMCTRRGEEYGWTGSACFRTTWGADGLEVFGNTFLGYSQTRERGGLGSTGQTRVLWVGLPYFKPSESADEIRDARAVFHDNLLVARGLDPSAKAAAIA